MQIVNNWDFNLIGYIDKESKNESDSGGSFSKKQQDNRESLWWFLFENKTT